MMSIPFYGTSILTFDLWLDLQYLYSVCRLSCTFRSSCVCDLYYLHVCEYVNVMLCEGTYFCTGTVGATTSIIDHRPDRIDARWLIDSMIPKTSPIVVIDLLKLELELVRR